MDNDPATLITELAKRGDLHSLICRVGRYVHRTNRTDGRKPRRIGNRYVNPYVVEDEKERTPVVVIWQIFDCRKYPSLRGFAAAALSLSFFRLLLSYCSQMNY